MPFFLPVDAVTPAHLLKQNKSLQQLLQHAQQLARLQQQLDSQLEPAARPYCRVASIQDGCLLLIITDAAWATRLRYRQQKLLQNLQRLADFASVNRIALKISPANGSTAGSVQRPQLSRVAATNLRETATYIEDPQLRAALERLASKAQQP